MPSRWLDENLTPPPGLRASALRPFEVAELDDHVDAGRIWATILEAREEVAGELDDAEKRGRAAAQAEIDEDAPSEEVLFEDYRDKITAALNTLKKSYTKANLEALEKVIAEG